MKGSNGSKRGVFLQQLDTGTVAGFPGRKPVPVIPGVLGAGAGAGGAGAGGAGAGGASAGGGGHDCFSGTYLSLV